MKKTCIISLFMLAVFSLHFTSVKAQNERIEVGGNFNLNLQNKMGVVEFSPVVGYRVLPFLTVNAGIICQYAWNKDNQMSEWSYGLSTGARLDILNFLYVEGRYVFNPYVINYKAIDVKERGIVQSFWVGAGYRQKIGPNAYTYAGIVYDLVPLLNHEENVISDYNPRFEAGVTYAF